MNTNALPQAGGIPLQAQPTRPPDPRLYPDAPPPPVQQQAPSAESAISDRQVKQPGVGSEGANIYQPGPSPADAQEQDASAANQKPPEQQLREAIGHASDTLLNMTTVFPFTLFPDTVTVDRSKLSVTKRFFFAVSEAFSIRIEDILNVTADVGPFFGSVQITTRFFATDKEPYKVNYLWRSDALRLKRILQGYIIATTKNIDCSQMPAKRLAHMLDELGKGAPAD